MRAVVYDAVGAAPVVREVAEPLCPDDGVVVAVGATGVCRSDWHAWRGHDPVELPHVPGHELAGTVVEVGASVRDFRTGERVTVPFVCGCGRCAVCLGGDPQVCPDQTQPGFTGPGSFAERVALHAADANLVRLPDAVDFITGASLGCRFATAYRGLTAHAHVRAGRVGRRLRLRRRRSLRGHDRQRARRPGDRDRPQRGGPDEGARAGGRGRGGRSGRPRRGRP